MTFKRTTPISALDLDPTDIPDATASLKGGVTLNQIDTRTKVLRKRNVPGVAGLPTAMASPPTVSASTTSAYSTVPIYPDRRDAFTYTRRMSYSTAAFPNYTFYWPMAAASTASGIKGNVDGARTTNAGTVSFITDAPAFEIICKGTGSGVRLRVNGELVTPGGGDTHTLALNGTTYYITVTFGSRAFRRIDVDLASNGSFGGVRCPITETVTAIRESKPRLLVLGDSFTEGTGATGEHTGFVHTLAQMLGCVPLESGWG